MMLFSHRSHYELKWPSDLVQEHIRCLQPPEELLLLTTVEFKCWIAIIYPCLKFCPQDTSVSAYRPRLAVEATPVGLEVTAGVPLPRFAAVDRIDDWPWALLFADEVAAPVRGTAGSGAELEEPRPALVLALPLPAVPTPALLKVELPLLPLLQLLPTAPVPALLPAELRSPPSFVSPPPPV